MNKGVGLVYIGSGEYVGWSLRYVLGKLGFTGVENIQICSEITPVVSSRADEAKDIISLCYIIKPWDMAISFQHE